MKYSWTHVTLIAAALVVLAYAAGDLMNLWEMEPLVVLLLSTIALLTGLRKEQPNG